jgi:hypothetical protein
MLRSTIRTSTARVPRDDCDGEHGAHTLRAFLPLFLEEVAVIARILLLLSMLLFTAQVRAQDPPGHWPERSATAQPAVATGAAAATSNAQGEPELKFMPTERRWHEPVEIIFSSAVLVFGLLLIAVFTGLVRREGKGWRTIYMRLVVLTIVVTAGLFVIVAGYTQDQIAPMMGLLGTLVGYLLGKESAVPDPPETPHPPAPAK